MTAWGGTKQEAGIRKSDHDGSGITSSASSHLCRCGISGCKVAL